MEQSQTEIDDKLPVIVCQQWDTNAGTFIDFQYVLVFIESKCIYKVRLFIVPQHPAPVAINNCYCQFKHHIYFFHKKTSGSVINFIFSLYIYCRKKSWKIEQSLTSFVITYRGLQSRGLACGSSGAGLLPHRCLTDTQAPIWYQQHSLAGWSIFFTPCSTAYFSLPFI